MFSNKRTDSGTLCSFYSVATLRRFNLNITSFIRYPSLQRFPVHSRQPANTLDEAEYVFRSSKLVVNRNHYSKPTEYTEFKQINQLDATVSQVYYLTFMYSSTCFGRPQAHQQELNCSSSLWFYRWGVVVAALLVVVWPVITGQTTPN